MKQDYIIHTKSFLKSRLSIAEYLLLQVIYEKDTDLFNHLKMQTGYISELSGLIGADYIKYTGSNWFENADDPDSLDIVDFILMSKSTELFAKDDLSKKLHEVDNWIGAYRAKFKGIKPSSMGDPKACSKKMKMFLKDNSMYTQEDIFKAVDLYISSTDPMYTMQADYFIYKSGVDRIPTSKLLMFCEQVLTEGISSDSTYGDVL